MLPTSAWRTTASDNPASDDWTVPANQHPLVQERTEPEFVNLVIDEDPAQVGCWVRKGRQCEGGLQGKGGKMIT